MGETSYLAGKPRRCVAGLCWALCCIGQAVYADAQSLGPQGIAASDLGLTGAGIAIGQVEEQRPGVPGFDDPSLSNAAVSPSGVFQQTKAAVADSMVGAHATNVASVLISNSSEAPGVAPQAALYSSEFTSTDETSALASMQHVAKQANSNVRAINMSFGLPGTPDGSSLLSRGTDWLARQQDVLIVNSGLQDDLTNYVPKDAYNNLVVGRLAKDAGGMFNRVSGSNRALLLPGGRTRPDIVAPGDDITVEAGGGGETTVSGTSFSAPHATGTVALLHQFVEQRISAADPRMTPDARRHELVKAVLLNSADKLADAGDGMRLGMQKTIVDAQGKDWTQSEAFMSLDIPLDDQLGAGALNASRAVAQIAAGEYAANGNIVEMGWDYGRTMGAGDFNRYQFVSPLVGGSFLSATLTWDRTVILGDSNFNQQFDAGEDFFDFGLTNLDLFLMPQGATDLSQMVWGSIADSDWNVEHIFLQVPQNGEYELWVYQRDTVIGAQNYALAWQAKMVPEPVLALHAMFAFALLGLCARTWRGNSVGSARR